MEVRKIYFDMDGVLADFDTGVMELAGGSRPKLTQTEEEDTRMWELIRKVPHFYDRLEPMPGAVAFFQKVYTDYGNRVEILTGIPKPHRHIDTAGEDKIAWAHRLLDQNLMVNIVFTEEKKRFCTGKDCILIDNYGKNILSWRAMGGTGILYNNAGQAEQDLERVIIST